MTRTTSARYWSGGRMPTGPLAARKRAASSRRAAASMATIAWSRRTASAVSSRGAPFVSGDEGSARAGGSLGTGQTEVPRDDRASSAASASRRAASTTGSPSARREPLAQARALGRRLALPQQPAVEAPAVGARLADERVRAAGQVPGRDEGVVDREDGRGVAEEQRGRPAVGEREAEEGRLARRPTGHAAHRSAGYSARRASMGSSEAARRAGATPETSPVRTLVARPATHEPHRRLDRQARHEEAQRGAEAEAEDDAGDAAERGERRRLGEEEGLHLAAGGARAPARGRSRSSARRPRSTSWSGSRWPPRGARCRRWRPPPW